MVGPAGGFGAAGGCVAAGGAARGGGGGGGGAGCGGGGGGGAGRGGGGGGGGGGAGRAGGAAFGASLGLGLGFPSGPSSSLACATTIGADCACEGAAANCMAVRAVVASSAIRIFVMMVWVPGEISARSVNNSGDQRTSVRPDCGSVQTRTWIYFPNAKSGCAFVHGVFRRALQIGAPHCPLYPRSPGIHGLPDRAGARAAAPREARLDRPVRGSIGISLCRNSYP